MLTQSVEMVNTYPVSAKSLARIGLLLSKSAQALNRSAFFVPTVSWWAVQRHFGAPTLAGKTNSVRSATFLIGLNSGSSSILQEDTTMSNSLCVFDYATQTVRINLIDNEPWFCLKDVCEILSIKNQNPDRFQLDDKGVTKNVTPSNGGNQSFTFINEPNLYRVIFRSNKSEAKKFQDWVFNEVLPSIRKTGTYTAPEPHTINDKQYQLIRRAVNALELNFHYKGSASWAVYKKLREEFGVTPISKLPVEQLQPCLARISQMREQGLKFKCAIQDLEKEFFKNVYRMGNDFDPEKIEQQVH